MRHGVLVTNGSIVELPVDVIVNSAHTSLLHGSGICGTIHRSAGSGLERYCRQLGGCSVGDAVLTPGFCLPAQNVIHAVSPKLRFGEQLASHHEVLWEAMLSRITELVAVSGASTVAIPPIGIGGHRIPLDYALPSIARLALEISENLRIKVFLVSRDVQHRRAWNLALKKLGQE